MSRLALALAWLGVGLPMACIDTGVDDVSIPLRVGGTDLTEPILARGGFEVTLDRADLAFGPLTLCAGTRAGELCETARAEWRDAAVVDVLDGAPATVGVLAGTGGTVRSAMYDLGIVSLLTQRDPLILEAAETLGRASLRLSGRAERDGAAVDFAVALSLQQGVEVEQGVPLVRVAATPELERDLSEPELSLGVRFDARPWVEDVDFEAVRDGCLPDCEARVTLEPDSQGYRAVRLRVLSGSRPQFEWSTP